MPEEKTDHASAVEQKTDSSVFVARLRGALDAVNVMNIAFQKATATMMKSLENLRGMESVLAQMSNQILSVRKMSRALDLLKTYHRSVPFRVRLKNSRLILALEKLTGAEHLMSLLFVRDGDKLLFTDFNHTIIVPKNIQVLLELEFQDGVNHGDGD